MPWNDADVYYVKYFEKATTFNPTHVNISTVCADFGFLLAR